MDTICVLMIDGHVAGGHMSEICDHLHTTNTMVNIVFLASERYDNDNIFI